MEVTNETPFSMEDALKEAGATLPSETQATEGQPAPAPDPKETAPDEPPFLKEPEAENDDELSSEEEIDKILEGETDEKRKAQQKAGISKLVNKLTAEQKTYQEYNERLEPVMSYLEAFEDPAQYEAALASLTQRLHQVHGKTPNQPQATTSVQGTDENTLWESETIEQTKARWQKEFSDTVLGQIKGILDERLGPVSEWHKQETAKSQAMAKVESSYGPIHGRYPFATKEMVSSAIAKFPSLDPMDAFKAVHADEIGRYAADYAKKLNTKPAGPALTPNNTTPPLNNAHEKPTSMAGIFEELGITIE